MLALKSALLTETSVPVALQVPFQPLFSCCQLVGQLNRSVQLAIALLLVLVMSTLPTYPLPQSLVSLNFTAQSAGSGVPVAKVSGGEAQDTRPDPSRVITLIVYRVAGLRLCTVKLVAVVSHNCSLVVPFWR